MSEDFKDYLALSILGFLCIIVLGGVGYIFYLMMGWWSVTLMGFMLAVSWAVVRIHPSHSIYKPPPLPDEFKRKP